MFKLLLLIRDYLIVNFGARRVVLSASLDLCDWVKSSYPLLTSEEVLIVTATLISSVKAMHEFYPARQAELHEAIYALISNRYKK